MLRAAIFNTDDGTNYHRVDEELSAPSPFMMETLSKIDQKRLLQLLPDAMSGKAGFRSLVPDRSLLPKLGKTLLPSRPVLSSKKEMDAERHNWHARSDEVAQTWRHFHAKNGEATSH